MKKVKKTFHPDDISVLKFSIEKLNSKKYNKLTPDEVEIAIEFFNECEQTVRQFKDSFIRQYSNSVPAGVTTTEPTQFQQKIISELREKLPNLIVDWGRGDRILVNGEVLKGVTLCDYSIKKLAATLVDDLLNEIKIQFPDNA